MSYILDTHTLLWFIENDNKPSSSAKSIIVNLQTPIYVSVVSIWEIVIKVNIGKFKISASIEKLLQFLDNQAIEVLPLSNKHLSVYASLPLHHRDPFDRMIIVQDMEDNLVVLGTDTVFDKYAVKRKW
ncbi:MAG: type II toxin-antitoxin system VapC family toxin [Bacteroidota bacterium]